MKLLRASAHRARLRSLHSLTGTRICREKELAVAAFLLELHTWSPTNCSVACLIGQELLVVLSAWQWHYITSGLHYLRIPKDLRVQVIL